MPHLQVEEMPYTVNRVRLALQFRLSLSSRHSRRHISRYSGRGETAMDEDLKAVASDNPLQALLKNVQGIGKALEVSTEEFDDAGERNPLFPMTYAAARRNKAKDWFKLWRLVTLTPPPLSFTGVRQFQTISAINPPNWGGG